MIQIIKSDDGYFTVHAGGRIAPDLNWHEMLALIASLTILPGASLQWLITPEQHAADVAKRKAALEREAARPEPSGPPPTLCEACRESITLSEAHVVTGIGLRRAICAERPPVEKPEPGNAT